MLIFVEGQYLPARKEKERRYRMHKNGREYPDYLHFLNQAIGQSLFDLDRGMRELDYGCGSVPALSVLLEERGMQNIPSMFLSAMPKSLIMFMNCTGSPR